MWFRTAIVLLSVLLSVGCSGEIPRTNLGDDRTKQATAAGLRMIERGAFSDPASPRTALLIEAGQHWERSAVDVAIDTALRFLAVTGAIDEAWAKPRLRLKPPAVQRLVRVTEAVVVKSASFRFAKAWKGLEVAPKAGTPVAYDGDTVWRTPYDDCVMVMPGAAHLKPGNTAVRLGRYAD